MNARPSSPSFEPPAEPSHRDRALRAGPLTLRWVDGDLRRVRWGSREVIRRLYGAVRDRNWITVPGERSDETVEASGESFRASYVSTHRAGDLHFRWQAQVEGEGDGTLRFRFEGEALSEFWSNRIGLCLLHPLRECVGARCRTCHADGSGQERMFPQWVAAEQPVPGFTDLVGMAHEVVPGLWMEAAFSGDLFETEDQRNWIDASFKTYSTPLRLPFPIQVRTGSRVVQEVVLRLRGEHGGVMPVPSRVAEPEVIRVCGVPGHPILMPPIGLGMASHGRALDPVSIDRLGALGLTHLRADLRLETGVWRGALGAAARDAEALGCALELAVHLPRQGPGNFGEVASELVRLRVDLTRALILREGERSTLASDLAAARTAFEETGMAVGAGTDGDLYQLHLQPPPPDGEFLGWSMNPQVHAEDDLSLMETPEAVPYQVATLRHRYPGLPLVVSPVTLKPRFNPVATGPATECPGSLPPQVDPRQATPLGAAWTVAMLRALFEGGVESVTLFETTGWRGVMDTADGAPPPGRFPSYPGGVFPLYHVLADVGEMVRGSILPTVVEGGTEVAPLWMRDRFRQRLLLANLTAEHRRVTVSGCGGEGRLRMLDAQSVSVATLRPSEFRRSAVRWPGPELILPPYAVATLDFSLG
jgi:hypothetical protein